MRILSLVLKNDAERKQYVKGVRLIADATNTAVTEATIEGVRACVRREQSDVRHTEGQKI